LDWIGLCSVLRSRQHSIGYMGDGFYRSKDPTNRINQTSLSILFQVKFLYFIVVSYHIVNTETKSFLSFCNGEVSWPITQGCSLSAECRPNITDLLQREQPEIFMIYEMDFCKRLSGIQVLTAALSVNSCVFLAGDDLHLWS